MASTTQDTSTFAAAQKLTANSTLAGAKQLISDLGLASEIEAFPVVVQVRLDFRQPSGSSWTTEQFETQLRALKLIP